MLSSSLCIVLSPFTVKAPADMPTTNTINKRKYLFELFLKCLKKVSRIFRSKINPLYSSILNISYILNLMLELRKKLHLYSIYCKLFTTRSDSTIFKSNFQFAVNILFCSQDSYNALCISYLTLKYHFNQLFYFNFFT